MVPGLPTTVFLLIALWAFARSSPRFHDWLYYHPRFGPGLQAWREHGAIPVRVKAIALIGMTASLSVMIFVSRVPWAVVVVTFLVMAYGAWFILTRPSAPAAEGARKLENPGGSASSQPVADHSPGSPP